MFKPPKSLVTKKTRVLPEGLLCNYQHHLCQQNRVEGHEHCIRHILEEKSAPYKQCNYIYTSSGKRCTAAAPKMDKKDGFCMEHSKKALLLRQRASRKRQPPETPESLLQELAHYCCSEDIKPSKRSPQSSLDAEVGEVMVENHEPGEQEEYVEPGTGEYEAKPKALDPFVDIDPYKLVSRASKVLDYGSEADSDSEPAVIENAWRGDGDSDAESVDSDLEDPLKHAGIYTAEEVALTTRDKLIHLQSLYIEQFKRLQHILREKRRQYIHHLRKEKDTMMSIHNSPRDDPTEQHTYKKLCALNRYHRRRGMESVMHRQAQERRAMATEGSGYKPPSGPKCIYTEGGVKCGDRTIPISKYCQKHILEDQHQSLFRRCGSISSDNNDGDCATPVPGIFDGMQCMFHARVPPMPHVHSLEIKCEASVLEPSQTAAEYQDLKNKDRTIEQLNGKILSEQGGSTIILQLVGSGEASSVNETPVSLGSHTMLSGDQTRTSAVLPSGLKLDSTLLNMDIKDLTTLDPFSSEQSNDTNSEEVVDASKSSDTDVEK